MVVYPNVEIAFLKERKNRFIAHCFLPRLNQEVIVHVKNTGRCKELFYPDVPVAISYQASASRKTDWDLIAVQKGADWINIDSQVPNQLVYEGLQTGALVLPNLAGKLTEIKREVTFNHSRFDVYLETDKAEKVIIEVKGMTLENQQVVAFPDAPTERGLKHVKELMALKSEGYHVYLFFVVQLSLAKVATIHEKMQPELQKVIASGLNNGLTVIAQTCRVTPETITLAETIPFDLEQVFNDPTI